MADSSDRLSNDDWMIGVLVIGALLTFIIWALTKFFYPELTEIWRYFRIAQLHVWLLITYPLDMVGIGPSPEEIQRQISWMLKPPGGLISPEAKEVLDRGWTGIWSKVFAIGTVLYAFKFWLGRYERKRIQIYDYQGTGKNRMGNAKEPLLRLAAQSNPGVAQFVDENPADYPVSYRPYENNKYAQRITPWDFARFSIPPGLDTIDGNPHKDIGPIFDPAKPRGMRFNLKAADTVFSWQLGERSDGRNTLKKMSKAEKKVFDHVLKNLYGGKKAANRIVSKHAYIRTALLEMYFQSTANTAEMRWLKYEDRTLFFALQDANLNVTSAESAGVWAHWKVERTNQMPVPIPAIEYAVHWMANLADVGDDELAEYIKEDESVQSDPDYWANQSKEAKEVLDRLEAAQSSLEKPTPKRKSKATTAINKKTKAKQQKGRSK